MGEDDLLYWSKGNQIIGIDDAGRGTLAGSYFSAIVSFTINDVSISNLGLKDSKKISTNKRLEIEKEILKIAKTKIVEVTSDQINTGQNLNDLLYAAINDGLKEFDNDYIVFFDGSYKIRNCRFEQVAKPKFDNFSWHVAAASILAKNAQVRAMEKLDAEYPQYGFKSHNGYARPIHYEMIKKYGMIDAHRKSWIRK